MKRWNLARRLLRRRCTQCRRILCGGKQVSGGGEGLGRRRSSPEDDDLLAGEGVVFAHREI